MDRIRGVSALAAFLIAGAMVTTLIMGGHSDKLQIAAVGVGALSLAMINVWRTIDKKDGPK